MFFSFVGTSIPSLESYLVWDPKTYTFAHFTCEVYLVYLKKKYFLVAASSSFAAL